MFLPVDLVPLFTQIQNTFRSQLLEVVKIHQQRELINQLTKANESLPSDVQICFSWQYEYKGKTSERIAGCIHVPHGVQKQEPVQQSGQSRCDLTL